MNILQYLCKKLVMDKSEIIRFSLTAPYRYKIYKIDKRNSNKKRIIAQPSKELKFIQRVIISYLEDKLPIHSSCYAYKKNKSIKDNASVHLNTKYLLKMDFENFFPSITPELFFEKLEISGININNDDRLLLKNLLFFRSKRNSELRLSIGAPSSPFISNFVMFFFDEELKMLCDAENINYSRYADDLTFSTNKKDFLFDIPNIVIRLIYKYSSGSIKVNDKKTIFSSKAHNRHVTGMTRTNDNKLSTGRENKRLISVMIHYFINNKLDKKTASELYGMIAFAKFIEPDFYERICKKYGEENIEMLKEWINE